MNAPTRYTQPRSLRTRQRIIESFARLVEKSSIKQVTIENIAKAAHVSIGAIYRHFPSRDELEDALMGHVLTVGVGYLGDILDESNWVGRNLAARIGFTVDYAFMQCDLHQSKATAVLSWRFSPAPPAPSQSLSPSRQQLDLVVDWLLRCRNEITHPSPEQALRIATCFAIHSLQTELLFIRGRLGIEQSRLGPEMKRMLLAYLCPGSQGLPVMGIDLRPPPRLATNTAMGSFSKD